MTPSKKIDKIASLQKLEYIRVNVCQISEERITAAVQSIRKSEKITALLRLFSELNNMFVDESDTLKEEARTYNQKYATAINGKFSTAYNALSSIKVQVFFLYRLMNAVSSKPKVSQSRIMANTNCIEFNVEHTLLGNMPYTVPMFECNLESQKRLILEISSFIQYLDSNLKLCEHIVMEEKAIGEDDEKSMYLFEKQLNEVYEYLDNYKKKSTKIGEKYYQELIDVENHPDAVKKWFHKLNPKELIHVAHGLKDNLLKRYTVLERKTFKEDPKKLQRYRKVMSNLHNVVGKITGEVIVYVQRYTECDSSQSGFLKCFKETYQAMGGEQKIVTPQQYNQAYTKYYYDDNEYMDFRLKMDQYCQLVA